MLKYSRAIKDSLSFAGENLLRSKAQKARSLGTELLSEQQFLSMVE